LPAEAGQRAAAAAMTQGAAGAVSSDAYLFHERFGRQKRAVPYFFAIRRRVNMKVNLKKLVLAGVFLALCLLLPFVTGQIPQIGAALAPMHIPVLLCGFVCGWPYGLVVGFVAPLLRFMLFGMPPIFPTGIAMAFELAVYGALTGILYQLFPKKTPYIYVSLILSMAAGRVVWGAARFFLAGLTHSEFSFAMFAAGAFVAALPGIILHIALVPVIVIALRRARLMPNA
jgi:thiamine transporter ThiT